MEIIKYKKFLNYLIANFWNLYTSSALILLPLIYNQSLGAKGWELPKVEAIQLFSIISIILAMIYLLNTKNLRVLQDKKLAAYLMFFIFTGIVFLQSEFTYSVNNNTIKNFIYKVIIDFLNLETLSMPLWGNEYRYLGVITIALIFVATYLLIKITKQNFLNYLLWSFIISSLVQSLIGLYQFVDVYFPLHDLDTVSGRVYGTFGQPNFYADFLLIGFFSAILTSLNNKGKYRVVLSIFFATIIFISIVISMSYWAIITVVFGLAMIAAYYGALKARRPGIYFTILLITLFLFLPTAILFSKYAEVYSIRVTIWKDIWIVYTRSIEYTLLGSGPDTLGEVLRQSGKLRGLYVDRAHNFIFDIFAWFGLVGITLFSYLITWLGLNFKRNFNNKASFIIFTLIVVWVFRGLVHTGSIINYFEFIILLNFAAIHNKSKTLIREQ